MNDQDEREKAMRDLETALSGGGTGVRDAIVRDIGCFTVSLLAVTGSGPREELKLCGTGTLVSIGPAYFILTAAHVWELGLRDADGIGLTLKEHATHSFVTPTGRFQLAAMKRPEKWNEWGPDLALIRIPDEKLGEIKAYKSFYNLERDRPQYQLSDCIDIQLLIGTPEVAGKFSPQFADLQIQGMYYNPPQDPFPHDGLDYVDLRFEVGPGKAPREFGGVSGGGLWSLSVYWNPNKKVDWTSTLVGVAFHQSELRDDCRTVRCHGVHSIQAMLREIVK